MDLDWLILKAHPCCRINLPGRLRKKWIPLAALATPSWVHRNAGCILLLATVNPAAMNSGTEVFLCLPLLLLHVYFVWGMAIYYVARRRTPEPCWWFWETSKMFPIAAAKLHVPAGGLRVPVSANKPQCLSASFCLLLCLFWFFFICGNTVVDVSPSFGLYFS